MTSLYAGLLAVLYFKLSLDTIKARRRNKISLGVGANNEIVAIVSAHHNFASYVPLLLLLTFFAESSGQVSNAVLHGLAAAFTLGRALHYVAFARPKMDFKLRVVGMHLTLWPLVILAGLNLYGFFARG